MAHAHLVCLYSWQGFNSLLEKCDLLLLLLLLLHCFSAHTLAESFQIDVSQNNFLKNLKIKKGHGESEWERPNKVHVRQEAEKAKLPDN